jgi:hypothetical protein
MDTLTILVTILIGLAIYIIFFRHRKPVIKCIPNFYDTKDTLLSYTNGFWSVLDNFSNEYGTHKQGIVEKDPLLEQLETTISFIKTIKRGEAKSEVISLYGKLSTDIQQILDIVHQGKSPNLVIMATNKQYQQTLNDCMEYVGLLSSFPLKIASYIAECLRGDNIY